MASSGSSCGPALGWPSDPCRREGRAPSPVPRGRRKSTRRHRESVAPSGGLIDVYWPEGGEDPDYDFWWHGDRVVHDWDLLLAFVEGAMSAGEVAMTAAGRASERTRSGQIWVPQLPRDENHAFPPVPRLVWDDSLLEPLAREIAAWLRRLERQGVLEFLLVRALKQVPFPLVPEVEWENWYRATGRRRR